VFLGIFLLESPRAPFLFLEAEVVILHFSHRHDPRKRPFVFFFSAPSCSSGTPFFSYSSSMIRLLFPENFYVPKKSVEIPGTRLFLSSSSTPCSFPVQKTSSFAHDRRRIHRPFFFHGLERLPPFLSNCGSPLKGALPLSAVGKIK